MQHLNLDFASKSILTLAGLEMLKITQNHFPTLQNCKIFKNDASNIILNVKSPRYISNSMRYLTLDRRNVFINNILKNQSYWKQLTTIMRVLTFLNVHFCRY